jgi:uncharacterized protein
LRVVVTGGTGFVGGALVRALLDRGDDVTVLSRGAAPAPEAAPGAEGKLELATWNPRERGPWFDVVEGASAVVHLAGAPLDQRWTDARKKLLRESRIRSAELLAEAIARADAKPRVFVSGSAVGYYGIHTGERFLTEESPPGDDFLACLTRDWESAATGAAEAGVRVCHPRLGLVMGRGGGVLGAMLPAFRAFVGGPVGTGEQYVPWIHLRDAVRALEHAIDRDDFAGAFNATAPEPVTMNTFARTLGAVLGRPSLFRVPAFAIKAMLGSGAEAVLSGQRALPKRLVDAGFAFVFPDLTSALADLVA